jgi:hypothetical protein
MRVLLGALLVVAASPARGQGCAVARLDVADWALVRSADVPGFTLRLPRAFTRDSTPPSNAARATSRTAWWADATRGRLGIRSAHDSSAHAELASAGGRSGYLRCEERVGSAVAVIVHYEAGAQGNQNGPFVVRARIRWADGEELDVRGDAPDRERLAQLLTAVRTIRRSGA